MNERKSPMRWRKVPARRFWLETHELWQGSERLATAQKHIGADTWYWYGGGRNTCNREQTLVEVKAEAIAYFKEMRP